MTILVGELFFSDWYFLMRLMIDFCAGSIDIIMTDAKPSSTSIFMSEILILCHIFYLSWVASAVDKIWTSNISINYWEAAWQNILFIWLNVIFRVIFGLFERILSSLFFVLEGLIVQRVFVLSIYSNLTVYLWVFLRIFMSYHVLFCY